MNKGKLIKLIMEKLIEKDENISKYKWLQQYLKSTATTGLFG